MSWWHFFFASLSDSRSWLKACIADLAWLAQLGLGDKYKFSPQEWFRFSRSHPTAARTLVRNACASSEARRTSLAQLKPAVARAGVLTCTCGKVCKSRGGFAVHLLRAHGIRSPAACFASSDGMCMVCGMVFSSRLLLQNHFTRGSQLCLLNVLLTYNPFTPDEELHHKEVVADAA